MSKHTSGPWKVQQMEYGFAITDQEGYEISPTRNISDARLIAAAPELLDMLEKCYEMEWGYGSGVTHDEMVALIAKAKGGKA